MGKYFNYQQLCAKVRVTMLEKDILANFYRLAKKKKNSSLIIELDVIENANPYSVNIQIEPTLMLLQTFCQLQIMN